MDSFSLFHFLVSSAALVAVGAFFPIVAWCEEAFETASFELQYAPRVEGTNVHFLHNYEVSCARCHCAIESALRRLEGAAINVYVQDVDKFTKEFAAHNIAARETSGTLYVHKLNETDVFSGTLLEQWYNDVGTSAEFKSRGLAHITLADALRLALVYKHGGIYLDVDAIPITPKLLGLKDTIAQQNYRKEHGHFLNNHFFSFDAHHPFLRLSMLDFLEHYEAASHHAWGEVGPALITRVGRRCFQRTVQPDLQEVCKDMQIAPARLVAPVHWSRNKEIFNADMSQVTTRWLHRHLTHDVLIVHYSENGLKRLPCLAEQSLFVSMAQDVCPSVLHRNRERIVCQPALESYDK